MTPTTYNYFSFPDSCYKIVCNVEIRNSCFFNIDGFDYNLKLRHSDKDFLEWKIIVDDKDLTEKLNQFLGYYFSFDEREYILYLNEENEFCLALFHEVIIIKDIIELVKFRCSISEIIEQGPIRIESAIALIRL